VNLDIQRFWVPEKSSSPVSAILDPKLTGISRSVGESFHGFIQYAQLLKKTQEEALIEIKTFIFQLIILFISDHSIISVFTFQKKPVFLEFIFKGLFPSCTNIDSRTV
jgi:hypothetical protein